MQLPLRNFAQLVADAAAGVQGSARALVDLSVGSTLRAVLEANASVALWMQWIAVQVLAAARASTSEAEDLDSWMADFGLVRLPATVARGEVTLSRYVPALEAFVPVGAQLRSGDGALTFSVIAEPGRAGWDGLRGGYAIGAGVAALAVPVVADAAGAAGNVQAGSVTLLATALAGVDTASNAAPLSGGLEAESDAALRARFANWMDSRSRATPLAVVSAVEGVQQGLETRVLENQLPDGTARMGSFVVVVDDGSGTPPEPLLARIRLAVDAVRPVGTGFAVVAPTVLPAAIQLTVQTLPGASHSAATAAVGAAIRAWVDALPIGGVLPFARLMQLAFQASPDVLNVTLVSLNGGAADLDPGAAGVVKAGLITVA